MSWAHRRQGRNPPHLLGTAIQGNVFSLGLPGPLRGVTVTEPDGTCHTIDWSD